MIIKFADGKGYFDSETKTALIMRDGVYTYLAMEFPGLVGIGADKENNPFAKLRVYRSKDSVKAAYEQFKELGKIPVVFNHPEKDLDRNDFSQGYGYAPELVDEGANLAIKCKLELNADSLEAYKDGIREISCGWGGYFVEPSEEDKKLYDLEQTFSDFNHIAIVSEGRCGSLCSIKDSKANKDKNKNIQEGLNGLIGAEKKGATKMSDKKKLFSDACKYVDELEKVAAKAKKSETVEDSHAEGLLNAVKGLKDVIKGLEEFAKAENKEMPEGPEGPEGSEPKEPETPEAGKVTDEEPKEPKAPAAGADGAEEPEEPTKVVPVEGKPVEEDGKTKDDAPEAGKDGEDKGKEEDKRQILREADKVAMLPVSEFEGGEEEKFRTLTALLGKLGYGADRAKKVNDAAIAKRITDAKNEGMKIAVKRFHDVLPFIADGTIPFSDIKAGMTPCEIKQKFVEERTGIKYNDAASLGVAFEVVSKEVAAESWNVKDTKAPQNLLDEKMAEVANIGIGQKK